MSQEKFKAEVLPIRAKLFHVARKMLENEQDAEDTVQEALLRLWRMRDSLDQYSSVEAFSITITKNLCVDKLRTRGRNQSLDDSFREPPAADNPYLQVERLNTEQILHRIIETLPPLQQAIIKMKDVEEYEVEEIAEITGTQVEAVRVNLSRARKKVREEYLKWTS